MKIFINTSSKQLKIKDFSSFALLKISFLFFFFFVFCNLKAQKQFILIDSQTKKEFIKKDSLSAVKFLDSLSENNYYFTQVLNVEKHNNNTRILFDKGKNFNQAQVKLSDEIVKNLKLKSDFFIKNLDSLKKSINLKYIEQGFAFSRVKTKYLGIQNGIPSVEISINTNEQRKIDGFVVKGYEKVPKRFIKNLEKEFLGKTYDDKNLIGINQGLQNHPFVTLERPPQTLFTKDSTNIYLFLQKKKINSFDGIIGFGNDKTDKLKLNGTLNLQFKNIFNGFESVSLFWQRNADKGQTFDLQTDIPYLFNSNIGTNININIFRQDSTYANVKMLPSFYYNISNRQKIGFRGTFEISTVTNDLYAEGQDYNKKGIGLWYDFTQPSEVELFLYKSRIRAEADFISSLYTKNNVKASQQRYFIFGEHNLHLSGNHYVNVKGESALMSSDKELTANELLRFGGWNSLRGFNENSLLADFYYFGNAEYRYLVSNQAFFDAFLQYGQLRNKTLSVNPRLYSFGLGFNFFLPIGLMSFQISNGSEFGNNIRFGDTKIHWGILTRF